MTPDGDEPPLVRGRRFWKTPACRLQPGASVRSASFILTSAFLAFVPAPTRTDDAADLAHGERLWGKCRACHTLEAGGKHRVGPNLHGVFGRAAAALSDYNYSEAMRRSGVVWSEETLDRFLGATQDFLPGTKMYGGLALEKDRRDLIAWLKGAAKAGD
jgi:cytochrome c